MTDSVNVHETTSSSYVHGPSTTPLLGETIGACLNRIAAQWGDRDAVISCHQKIRYTYRELLAAVDDAARGLLALGVQPGDRVGIWSGNAAEWTVTQYAAAKAGAILVNVNPAYRMTELAHALTHADITVLVAARRFRNTDYTEMLVALAPELQSAGRGAPISARLPSLKHIVYLGVDGGPGGMSWPEFIANGRGVSLAQLRAVEATLQFDDPVNIQYTSGTTGSPKGATLSHHNILNNGFFIGEMLRYTPEDRVCVPVPLYHCFGCVLGNLAALTHGAAVIMPGESFDPEATLRAIQEHRCTSIYGVPMMFIAALEHPRFDSYRLDSLRTGIMAGAPCPTAVMRSVIDRMHVPEVTICYGMTETSPVSFQSAVDDPLERRVSTVGRVHPHVECKVIDPVTGAAVPRGTSGELCTRGYLVMLGYWRNRESTDAVIDTARWMHTGDLAILSGDGYLKISGRLKDLIIRGGDNISPREIEDFLHSHSKVSDVQVIGVPDLKYGEEVCAWIRLRDGQVATAEELRDFCRGKIATYKIPRYIKFVSEFPATVSGKVQKFRMREIAVEELGLTEASRVQTA
jgi:fatty-acyl-CoA synthase